MNPPSLSENGNTDVPTLRVDHTAKDSPTKALVMPYLVHHWANLSIIPILRERFGTTFVVVVSGAKNAARYQPHLTAADSILELDEFTETPSDPPDEAEVFDVARNNEARYGICYMRDVLQMDRNVFTSASGVAPNSRVGKLPPFDPVATCHLVNVLFDRLESLFDEHGIDLVLGWPIALQDACCAYVARRRGILTTHPYVAKLENRAFWATGPFVTSEQHRAAYDEAGDRIRTSDDAVTLASPAKPVNLDAGKVSSLYSNRRTAALVLQAIKERIGFYLEDFQERRLPWRVNRVPFFTIVRNHLMMRNFFRKFVTMCRGDLDDIGRRPFVFYAFHQEPEFTVQAQAKDFNDQAAIIRQIAKSLPAGVNLVIKEHATIGHRPLGYYQELLCFPNVIMAHPDISGIELVRRATSVASLRGTVTLEAALLGKPALVFVSDSEFAVLPNVRFVSSFHDMHDALTWATRTLSEKDGAAYRQAALRFREAMFDISFAAPPLFSKDGSLLDAPDADRAVDLLVRLFQRFHDDVEPATETALG